MTHLILVGHGSHLNPDSSEPTHALVAALRATGEFDRVTAAFWKEEPSLARALDAVTDPDVVIVPVFISTGYFTRTVIPREMRLKGPLTIRDGQRITYTAPVGTHPALAEVIIERASEAGAGPADAVVVLGHGTRRDSESEKNVLFMADLVAARRRFAEVSVAFIDQEPGMLTMLERVSAPRVFVVPLFIAEGWHVGETIPADLALDGPETRRDGRVVHYTPPVGTHPSLARVVSELARPALQARATERPASTPQLQLPGSLGELRIEADRVCGPGTPTVELPPDPDAIRRHVRFDGAGRYRPLPGARGLRSGWYVRAAACTAADIVEVVYPLALVHRQQAAAGSLRVVPLDAVLARQSGRYESAAALSPRGRELVREILCGQCVRTPAWPLTSPTSGLPTPNSGLPTPNSGLPTPNSGLPTPNSELPTPNSELPCPEPCSVFVALAREAAAWEADPPAPAPPDPAVPAAAFETPGCPLRERLLTSILESSTVASEARP